MSTPSPSLRPVSTWLVAIYALIAAMVVIGGITRLTGSGLSMVDWHPLMGTLPPLDDAAWQAVFERYQQSPQYAQVNHWMTLADFKQIFFWEYVHRLLGRLIGVAFFVPWLVFVLQKRLHGSVAWRAGVAFLLGGAQGLLGWFMVKSGLVDRPSVSHFRLAAHLCLALFILAYVFDLVLSMSTQQSTAVPSGFRRIVQIFTLLLVAQLIYGGFTAGLKAGLGFNTYPKMGEAWIAEAALTLAPFWLNWFENGAMIQFIHRWLGLAVLVAAAVTLGAALSQDAGVRVRRAAGLCVGLVFVQFLLGIITLITVVPLSWALTHQVFACFVVLGLTYLNFLVRPRAVT